MNFHRVINKLTLATLRFHLAAVYSISLLRQIRIVNVINFILDGETHTHTALTHIISVCVCVRRAVGPARTHIASARSGNLFVCVRFGVRDTELGESWEQTPASIWTNAQFKLWFLFRWEKRFSFHLFRAGMRSELVGKCGRGFCIRIWSCLKLQPPPSSPRCSHLTWQRVHLDFYFFCFHS